MHFHPFFYFGRAVSRQRKRAERLTIHGKKILNLGESLHFTRCFSPICESDLPVGYSARLQSWAPKEK